MKKGDCDDAQSPHWLINIWYRLYDLRLGPLRGLVMELLFSISIYNDNKSLLTF